MMKVRKDGRSWKRRVKRWTFFVSHRWHGFAQMFALIILKSA
ncbi:hypothetical protein ACFP3I_18970 [Chryseobacterium arachidis]